MLYCWLVKALGNLYFIFIYYTMFGFVCVLYYKVEYVVVELSCSIE